MRMLFNLHLLKFVLGLLLVVTMGEGMSADSPRKAREYMNRGQYGEAMRVYGDLASKHPDDARYLYNAGVAAYKALKFEEAQEYFDAASLSSDIDLQQQSFYNRGNALFKAGENEAQFEKKTQLWKEAIDQFDHAVKLNESDKLANDNWQFVKKQLENLEQQQKEQEKQNDPNEDKNEENEQDNQQQNDQNQSQENQQDQDQQQQQDPSEDPGKDQKESDSSEQEQKEGEEDQQDSKQKEDEKEQKPSEPGEEQEDKEASGKPTTEGEGPDQEFPQTTMTPQQAMQLLESEKDEAKALIFQPKEKRRNKRFKDW